MSTAGDVTIGPSGVRRAIPSRIRQVLAVALSAGAVSGLWLCATCDAAHAQAAPQSSETDASEGSSGNIAKGIVGGAMLGAEVVMLAESAFRLRPTWMYLTGAGAGALAGGYLGYQLSDGSSNKPPAFLLAGGIALIIPTIMGVLTATQYAPPDSRREPPGDDDEPPRDADPTDGEESSLPVRFDLPNVGLAQAFSRDELVRYRVHQVTELHLSLVRGAF